MFGNSGDGDSGIDISDIERTTYEHGAEPYKDPHVLEVLYHDQELTQAKIADLCGVSTATICTWMDRFEIETRPSMDERHLSISKSAQTKEKMQYKVPNGNGERENFYRHQLVALLCEDGNGEWAYSPEDIFGGDSHVHHEMAAPVAVDVPENLAVITPREHRHIHGGGGPALIDCVEATLGEMFDEHDGEPDPLDIPEQKEVRQRRYKREQWGGRIDSDQPADD